MKKCPICFQAEFIPIFHIGPLVNQRALPLTGTSLRLPPPSNNTKVWAEKGEVMSLIQGSSDHDWCLDVEYPSGLWRQGQQLSFRVSSGWLGFILALLVTHSPAVVIVTRKPVTMAIYYQFYFQVTLPISELCWPTSSPFNICTTQQKPVCSFWYPFQHSLVT